MPYHGSLTFDYFFIPWFCLLSVEAIADTITIDFDGASRAKDGIYAWLSKL